MRSRRRLAAVMLVLTVLVTSISGCGNNGNGEALYNAGTYSAAIRGHEGNMKISVTFSDDAITDIVIDEHKESTGIGTIALERLPNLIKEKQSLGLDAVTGATITSMALFEAVADCAEQAGANVAELKKRDPAHEPKAGDLIKLETDVLVIGGGGAGLSASIEAARAGSQVIILEKLDYLGGDTIRAGGGIEAAGTTFQEARGIHDKPEDFAAFIRSRGVSFRNPELLDVMVEQSADAVYFLADMGADMSMQVAGHGSPVERAHRPAKGAAGVNIVEPMVNEIENLDVDVYFGTPGYELLTEGGAVVGAKARHTRSGQEYEIKAKAVVIATGNFASNNEMVAEHDPRLKGISTNSAAGSTGDGIIMATAVGADLENMEIMRIRPTLPRVDNFIAVAQNGKRFMDEFHSSDTIFVEGDDLHIQAVADYPSKHYWVILDQESYDGQADMLSSYMLPNRYFTGDTLEDLAEQLDLDAETLKTTVEEWNRMLEEGKDTAFGRTAGMKKPIGEGKYYGIKVLPTAHTTAGGIRINTKGQVLDKNEQPIAGLYAGGEVTGGVHDGVSAVCGCIVYGRICGINAAEYAEGN